MMRKKVCVCVCVRFYLGVSDVCVCKPKSRQTKTTHAERERPRAAAFLFSFFVGEAAATSRKRSSSHLSLSSLAPPIHARGGLPFPLVATNTHHIPTSPARVCMFARANKKNSFRLSYPLLLLCYLEVGGRTREGRSRAPSA